MKGPVLIMAGGTGGHIFPGLAVAQALRERGVPVQWLGAAGAMETRLVPAAGIELHTLRIGGLRGKSLATLVRAPFSLLSALWSATRLFGRIRPRAVISFGGFAAGPGGVAAVLKRVPLVVHEQNRVAGFTNRRLAPWARRVLGGFPDALDKAEWVGNPVRAEIAALPAPAQRLGGRRGGVRLLVLGGSLGATALNVTVPAAVAAVQAQIPGGVEVRHQCGRGRETDTQQAYSTAGVGNVDVQAFIPDMADAYGWADLVVCRAGALTLAELAAAGIGSILVPYPHAVDDHQTLNAQFLVDQGAAELLPQAQLDADTLARRLLVLLGDSQRRLQMAENARGCARPDAAGRVAEACIEVAR